MGGKASGRNILSSSEKYGLRGAVASYLGSEDGKKRLLPGAGSTAVAPQRWQMRLFFEDATLHHCE